MKKRLEDSIGELLKNSGFEVEIVYDGEAGVAYGTLDIYDLIVLDVMMPKLDGYQVARQLRANRLGTPHFNADSKVGIGRSDHGAECGSRLLSGQAL